MNLKIQFLTDPPSSGSLSGLSVWPLLAALLLSLTNSTLLTLYSQGMHQGGDSTDLAWELYRPAFRVGVLNLAVAVYAAVPFLMLMA